MKLTVFLFLILATAIDGGHSDSIKNQKVNRIAFGSCSHQEKVDEQLWKEVAKVKPDIWVWLGDNIYGDTENMAEMKADYNKQKAHQDYQQLLKETDVYGIWDDHDFGANDAGKEYPKKNESKELLFDFLDVPAEHVSRHRKGAYQSYFFDGEIDIKLILLDTRYFRDALKWSKDPKTALENKNGKVLGKEQWLWLEKQLSDKKADLFLLASGIQVIPEDHRFEKWSNFPKERKKLFDLIAHQVKAPLVFLSGDRHVSEVSTVQIEGHDFPLYEFTSSSLTNPWNEVQAEENKHRLEQTEMVYEPNFAVLDIALDGNDPKLTLKYVGAANKELQSIQIDF